MRRQFKQVLGIPKLSVSGCNCEPLIYFWTNLKPLSSITIIACKTHKLAPPLFNLVTQNSRFLFRKLSFFQPTKSIREEDLFYKN